MNDKTLRENLKTILLNKDSLKTEKEGVQEERRALWIEIIDAIREGDPGYDIKGSYAEFERKAGYIKVINGKIKNLEKQLTDIIMGKGNHNEDQITIYDIEDVKAEAERQAAADAEKVEIKPEDIKSEDDPDNDDEVIDAFLNGEDQDAEPVEDKQPAGDPA